MHLMDYLFITNLEQYKVEKSSEFERNLKIKASVA